MSAADDLLAELRDLTRRCGPRITLARFCREIGISPATVARFCGSWTKLRIAAGLPARVPTPRTLADLRRLRYRRRIRQSVAVCELLLWGLVVWNLGQVGGNRSTSAMKSVGGPDAALRVWVHKKDVLVTPHERPLVNPE